MNNNYIRKWEGLLDINEIKDLARGKTQDEARLEGGDEAGNLRGGQKS